MTDKEAHIKTLKLYSAYVQELYNELNETVPLASMHGWKSTRVKLGEKMRKDIAKHLKECKLEEVEVSSDSIAGSSKKLENPSKPAKST